METKKLTRGEQKKERLLQQLQEKQDLQRKASEEIRQIKKELDVTESMRIVEEARKYNLTANDLSKILSNHFQMQDSPAGNIIPVKTSVAVLGTVTQKQETEKEKEDYEEIS